MTPGHQGSFFICLEDSGVLPDILRHGVGSKPKNSLPSGRSAAGSCPRTETWRSRGTIFAARVPPVARLACADRVMRAAESVARDTERRFPVRIGLLCRPLV